jgi:prophage DNA circulation protein
MAEDQQLRAYNVALRIESGHEAMDERSADRMLRILRPSVERLLIPALARTRIADLRIEDALPHSRETLLRREVQQLLDCSDDHVRRLQEKQLLTGPVLTQTGSGRLQTIYRDSLLRFLTTREL